MEQEIEYLFFAGILPSPFRSLGITTYHVPETGTVYHRHNFIQSVAVERGELSFRYENGNVTRCGAGELLVVPAGLEHLWCVTQAPCRAIQLGHDSFGPDFEELTSFYHDASEKIPAQKIGDAWPELFASVEKELAFPQNFSGTLLGAKLFELFALAARHSPVSRTGSREERVVRRALELIERDPRRKYLVADLAKGSGVSVSRFAHLFASYTGTSPLRCLNRKRIELACSLLTFSTLNISEIAAESGFESLYYFSRMFKKITGASPKEFRNHQQNCVNKRKNV